MAQVYLLHSKFHASKNGLGACLLQQNQPVAYASRAMSSSESNYAQIEKKLLAIVYGCERFNMYTYGAEIEVLSDHKPLESIFKKPLFKVPPRLQRMRLRLQKNNLKVRYVPGKFLYIADTLSRAFDQSNAPTDDDMHHGMEHFIHRVIIDLPISDVKLMELRELNCSDPTWDGSRGGSVEPPKLNVKTYNKRVVKNSEPTQLINISFEN